MDGQCFLRSAVVCFCQQKPGEVLSGIFRGSQAGTGKAADHYRRDTRHVETPLQRWSDGLSENVSRSALEIKNPAPFQMSLASQRVGHTDEAFWDGHTHLRTKTKTREYGGRREGRVREGRHRWKETPFGLLERKKKKQEKHSSSSMDRPSTKRLVLIRNGQAASHVLNLGGGRGYPVCDTRAPLH